ncbi:MAG: cytochrome b N-terminal domain-containing protein [Gemmatimonadota bacterium]
MFSRILGWIEERWPLSAVLRLGLDEDIPGGPSIAYTLGSATLLVFFLQILTGVWQLFYYVPTVDHAYDSLDYFRTAVPFGWLIHGLHYWGANAMVVLVALHMARVFIWGAYKKPREMTWLLGVVLLLMTLAMSFTGAPLPWDERGYWAAEVGTSIAGSVPFVGGTLKAILRGGGSMGQLTLSRFFVLHVAVIPGVLLLVTGLHIIAFRRFGSVGPWKEEKKERSSPFWPDQVVRDVLVGMVLFIVLVTLVTYAPPPFAGPADPVDASYQPKPEWNFLFLYQALKFFKGSWEPVGTVGVPFLGILALLLVPFVDRRSERNPRRRPLAMSLGAVGGGAVVLFTIVGYFSKPGGAQQSASSSGPPTVSVAHLSASARRGKKLFGSLGCTGCHTVGGQGSSVGPDLTNEALRDRSRAWLIQQLKNPKSHDSTTVMPSFASLSTRQINGVVDYLMSLGADSAQTAASASSGAAGAPSGSGASGGGAGDTATSGAPAATASSERLPPAAPTVPPSLPESVAAQEGSAAPSPTGQPVDSATAARIRATVHKLGPPGDAASMIGNVEHGKALFSKDCASCHGEAGRGGVPDPGSVMGTVPSLAPVDSVLADPDPQAFAENIDRFIQHGATPAGTDPSLTMQAFGDEHTLTQEEIANIEAYILSLNGVDRSALQHPGMQPQHFLLLVVGLFVLLGAVAGGAWLRVRAGGDAA